MQRFTCMCMRRPNGRRACAPSVVQRASLRTHRPHFSRSKSRASVQEFGVVFVPKMRPVHSAFCVPFSAVFARPKSHAFCVDFERPKTTPKKRPPNAPFEHASERAFGCTKMMSPIPPPPPKTPTDLCRIMYIMENIRERRFSTFRTSRTAQTPRSERPGFPGGSASFGASLQGDFSRPPDAQKSPLRCANFRAFLRTDFASESAPKFASRPRTKARTKARAKRCARRAFACAIPGVEICIGAHRNACRA